MSAEFKDKVVVITGAAGALGQAVAHYFDQQQAQIACLDISEAALSNGFPDYNDDDRRLYLCADLSSRDACKRAADSIISKWGHIDILLNIAGGFIMGDAVHETSDETWDFLFNLNTRSIMNTAAAVVPGMIDQGHGKIVNISAGAAHQGKALMGTYIASKSAVLRLTESMAMELRDKNINSNAILPGTIDTPRNRKDMPTADFTAWVKPESIAEVIAFLCSDAARDIHGAGIPVVGLS